MIIKIGMHFWFGDRFDLLSFVLFGRCQRLSFGWRGFGFLILCNRLFLACFGGRDVEWV